jgi:hypothetical protein
MARTVISASQVTFTTVDGKIKRNIKPFVLKTWLDAIEAVAIANTVIELRGASKVTIPDQYRDRIEAVENRRYDTFVIRSVRSAIVVPDVADSMGIE